MAHTGDPDGQTELASTPIAESDENATAIAVVAVGNPIMGDDGIGAQVLETLETSTVSERSDVTLANGGTTAFFALEAMSGCDRAIVVDAISTGAEPGTIHTFRYVDGAFADDVPEMTMHDFSFAEALQAGRDAYEIPEEVLIFGVEPKRIEMSMELSEEIEQTVPDLVDLIHDELPERPP
ncbi:hydrogenase maturation protease [Halodesulfurarchaeum sp.]|uniref:hydrogenase maturation protease n=1 Tax=Halodesulfurarchaeum sp. TaxID=1980530 RepID=UPI001BC4ED95|nr:hydrogenase maturation protease [Halodesulfurarchaeum sp.]